MARAGEFGRLSLMLFRPGPWFVADRSDNTVIGLLPAPGEPPRHPSQHPLKTLGGYTVCSRVADGLLASQLTCFPDLVRLVDEIIHMQDDRKRLLAEPGNNSSELREVVADQLAKLTVIAERLQGRLGTTGEWPPEARVFPGRTASDLPTFSRPHLEALTAAGLDDQVRLWETYRDTKDPFRGIIL